MSNKIIPKTNPSQPMIYQIRIEGCLDHQWADWFGGLTITPDENGETILTGQVIDQAALYGLLKKVRDLGMPLLSINRVSPARQMSQNSQNNAFRFIQKGEERMSAQKMIANVVDPDGKWFYRMGGISAIVFGIAYIVIIALYIPMGARPSSAEAWLAYIAGNKTTWLAILSLSVLTDFLLVPVALSLYIAMKGINKNTMLAATAFIGLFIVLDLALTWTNYASLITLSGNYATAASEAQRTVFVAAAIYPSSVVESNLIFIYNSLTLAVGILLAGLVMLKGIFGKSTAYLGLVTGILGVVSVSSSFFASSVSSISIILASILTTVWFFLVGYKLYRLGQQ